jgi:hypothetical protein
MNTFYDLPEGSSSIIRGYSCGNIARQKLISIGLYLGKIISRRGNFAVVGDSRIAIGKDLSRKILVEIQ